MTHHVMHALRIGLAVLVLAAGVTGTPTAAQQPFAAAAKVNGQTITNYEVQQRARFLGLLRAPDASFDGARERLIQEALQVQAARADGVEITPDELDAGLVEFAARGGLEPPQFIQLLERAGVAPEAFRDFVRNGLFWRRLVQARFGPRARPSDAEIERAFAQGDSGVRVLLSEIAIPLTPENQDEARALADRLSRTLRGQTAFQQAARRFSAAPTRNRGGRLDYVPISRLAPPIAAQVLALAEGEVTEPIDLGGFIGIYLLRDLDEGGATAPEALSVDYAEYLIPGGRSPEALAAAARLRARIDTCDDLYGVAKRDGRQDALSRNVAAVADLPADLRQTLAVLDDDEASTALTRDGFLRFVMLCGRVVEQPEGAFQALGQQLLNQRLASYADAYLAELRADAVIEIP